jgi:hypothetical protein
VWLNRDRKNMIWKAVQVVERRKVWIGMGSKKDKEKI